MIFSLAQFGTQLWTRDKARTIREQVEDQLRNLEPGGVLVLDMKGVEAFDFSFANELFGKILLALPKEHPGRFAVVEHLTNYTRENLTKALEGLDLVMIERRNKKPALIGKIKPVDLATFEAISQEKEPISSAQLKDKLGINLNAMNERLAKLTNSGLIYRKATASAAGREQFEYSVVF